MSGMQDYIEQASESDLSCKICTARCKHLIYKNMYRKLIEVCLHSIEKRKSEIKSK